MKNSYVPLVIEKLGFDSSCGENCFRMNTLVYAYVSLQEQNVTPAVYYAHMLESNRCVFTMNATVKFTL